MVNKDMRRLTKLLVSAAVLMMTLSIYTTSAFAVSALNESWTETQPSGVTFEVRQGGDENFNYFLTEAGDIVVKGDNEYWYYGKTGAEGIAKSEAKYLIDARPSGALTKADIARLRTIKMNYLNAAIGDQLASDADFMSEQAPSE